MAEFDFLFGDTAQKPQGGGEFDFLSGGDKGGGPGGAPSVAPGAASVKKETAPPDEARGIGARIVEGAQMGFGESKVPQKDQESYPILSKIVMGMEMPVRGMGAAIGGVSGATAGIAEMLGMDKAHADRLERDLALLYPEFAGIMGGSGRQVPSPGEPPRHGRRGTEPPGPAREDVMERVTGGEHVELGRAATQVQLASEEGKAKIAAAQEAAAAEKKRLVQSVTDEKEALEAERVRIGERTRAEEAAHAANASYMRRVHEENEARLRTELQGSGPTIADRRGLGEVAGGALRAKERQEFSIYDASYNDVWMRQGEFRVKTFHDIGTDIQRTLEGDGRIFDNNTPMATRAISQLDKNRQLNLKATEFDKDGNPLPPEKSKDLPSNLKGVESARKELNTLYRSARTPTDRAMMRSIIDAFDQKLEHFVEYGYFSGDPKVLDALKGARMQFHQYRSRWYPTDAQDRVGRAINQIVERNASPEEISNYLLGTGKVEGSGVQIELYKRLENMFGRESAPLSGVRQVLWDKARTTKGGNGISELANSTFGRTVYTAGELKAMVEHERGVRAVEQLIRELPSYERVQEARAEQARGPDTARLEAAKAALKRGPSREPIEEAKANYQRAFVKDIGGSLNTRQADYKKIINGTITPEELQSAIGDALTSPRSSGSAFRLIKAIEDIAGRESEGMAAVREFVMDRLTTHPDPIQQAQILRSFMDGPGKSIAELLYDGETRSMVRGYVRDLERKGAMEAKKARRMEIMSFVAGAALSKVLGHNILYHLGSGFVTMATGHQLRRRPPKFRPYPRSYGGVVSE